jgi:glycosyltransferase involved in cell wall biosynthesis
MASGRPVVATAVGGNPELVVDGKTGLLVPPNDPEAMAAAITKLLREPELRQQMGRAGRQRVEEQFSLAVMVRNYAKVYLEVFGRRFKSQQRVEAPTF